MKIKMFFKNVAILFLIITILYVMFNNLFAEKKFEVSEYTVTRGDTLWSIASNLSKSNNNLSINKIIYDIQKVNDMSNSEIIIGQLIYIPIYEA